MASPKPRAQTARKRTYQRRHRSVTRASTGAGANANKSSRAIVEIPLRRTSTESIAAAGKAPALPTRKPLPSHQPSPSRKPSPFSFLSASSLGTPVADFDSEDEDFGTPFQHGLKDGQGHRVHGDAESPTGLADSRDDAASAPMHRHTPLPGCSNAADHNDTPLLDCYNYLPPDRDNTPTLDRNDTPLLDRYNSLPPDRDKTPALDRNDTPLLDRYNSHPPDCDNTPTPDRNDTPLLDRYNPSPDRDNAPALDRNDTTPIPVVPASLLGDESSDDDEDLKGGPISAGDAEKVKAKYAEFDQQIVALAKELGHSVRSIQRIGGRVSRAVNPRKTIAWNVFQSSYPPNTDKSVSQADYTRLIVRPAYNELVKRHGGEKSDGWMAESARMILEHSQAKAVVTADIARHGGEVAKVMASQKKAWKRDFEVMSSLGVHCELTMLADNACSPAAHAQNGQLFGTPEMEAYYKSRRDFKSHVGDAYTFILSAKGRAKEADEHKSRVAQWEREEACKNPNKMKGLVANMLMKLFDPFVTWKTFPWLNLPQKLLTFKLKMEGVLPLSQFRLLGSHSVDAYNVNEIRAMYDALVDGRIRVLQRDSEGLDPGQAALITDCDGRVLMTVDKAWEMVEEKKKRGVQRAAVRAIARAKDKGVGVDEGEDVGGDDEGNHRDSSTATSANMGIVAGLGSRKRRREGADRQAKAKRTVKSSEFIEDSGALSEEPQSGSSLQSTGIPNNSGTAVGTSSNVSMVPLPHTRSFAVGPPITVSPALSSIQPDPFDGLGQIQLGAADFMNFPPLDPSLFQGPDFEALVNGYNAANYLGSSFNS